MTHKSKPVGVGEILAQLKKTTSLGKQLEQAQIWERWEELSGAYLSKHGRPSTLRDGTLRIEADSAVWMHKIAYVKWDLIKRINRLANRELVSDIFISLASEEDDAASDEREREGEGSGKRRVSRRERKERKE